MNEYTKLIISLINEYVNEKRYSFEFVKETCELLLEMKSKEEYRRAKVFGDKHIKKDPYIKMQPTHSMVKDSDGKFKSMDNKEIIHKLAIGEIDQKDIKRIDKNKGRCAQFGDIHNINITNKTGHTVDTDSSGNSKHTINIDKDLFKHHNAKEVLSIVSHEMGHGSFNDCELRDDIERNIDKVLGKNSEKVSKNNKHTDRNELRADVGSVGVLTSVQNSQKGSAKSKNNKIDAIKALNKEAKEAHRKISSDIKIGKTPNQTHDGLDQDVKMRTKFIKSLKDM